MKAVGYCRRSTDKQDVTIETQFQDIKDWCARNDTIYAGCYEDTVSGGAELESCTGLVQAISQLNPGDVLVVKDRSRLARDVLKARLIEIEVAARGCKVVTVSGVGDDDTPEGVLLRGILDLFSEYERLKGGERTARAARHHKENNKRWGFVPYGKMLAPDGTSLIKHFSEDQAICRMLSMREGGSSLREIANYLQALHIPTRQGGRWKKGTVAAILSRVSASSDKPSSSAEPESA